MPRDGGGNGINPTVLLGGGKLNPAAVGLANHPDARHTGTIQFDAGPLRHPVDHGRHVPTFVVRAVHFGGSAGVTEAPGVPGQHVESALPELGDAQRALDSRLRRIGITRRTPTGPHEYSRTGPAIGRRIGEPVDPDRRPVERREIEVGGDARHRHRLRRLPPARRLAALRRRSRRTRQPASRAAQRRTGRTTRDDEGECEHSHDPRRPMRPRPPGDAVSGCPQPKRSSHCVASVPPTVWPPCRGSSSRGVERAGSRPRRSAALVTTRIPPPHSSGRESYSACAASVCAVGVSRWQRRSRNSDPLLVPSHEPHTSVAPTRLRHVVVPTTHKVETGRQTALMGTRLGGADTVRTRSTSEARSHENDVMNEVR